MNIENESPQIPRHRRGEEYKQPDKFFKIRNILNIIFIIGAIAGMIVYFFSSHFAGTIIIIGAMLFKTVECCLRFFRNA